MAEIEGLNHSGLSVPNVREGEDFYERVLGAEHCNRISVSTSDVRLGRSVPHTCNVLGDYLFVLFAHRNNPAMPESPRGVDGARHGFAVSRSRFDEIVERAREEGIAFEGPVTHPEAGPLGQSIYFTDPGGNFMEVCWRRDEEQTYNPVMAGG
jgi:catechol 2,3-dioxygenase-like lactoylglutathione lyase family enzyme